MNTRTLLHVVAFLGVSALTLFQAKAQHGGTGWDGGNGTWNANATNTNWDGTNVYFNSNDRTTVAKPVFYNGGGTVTVDDSQSSLPLTFGEMDFYNAGNWTLNGDALDNVEADYSATVVYVDAGAGNVTINNTINIAPNPTNGGSAFTDNVTNGSLTLGNLNLSGIPQSGTYGNGTHYSDQSAPFTYYRGDNSTYTVNSQTFVFFGAAGSTITLNGKLTTDAGLYGGALFGNYGQNSTATYVINGGLEYARSSNKAFDFGSGKIVLNTADTGTGDFCFVGNGNSDSGAAVMSILTNTAGLTISNNMYAQNRSNSQIGSEAAGNTTYTGTIYTGQGAGNLDLYAGTGSTVTFTGNLGGDNAYTSKSGAGTVILAEANGNNYATPYTMQAFAMNGGTTIIRNSSGSAFGSTTAGVHATIASGATLGGSGISTQAVVALAADSVIAPGVQTNSATTLHLNGGLNATNGMTMNFTLYGAANDAIDFGGSTMNLNGLVTINLTGIPTIDGTNNGRFKILTGLDLTDSNLPVDGGLSFDINPPAGYTVSDFGSISGGPSGTNDYIYVDLAATPEPSTYAMLGLGLCGLAFFGRRKLA